MTGRRFSIGQMMMAVALIAANLALAQALPPGFRLFPTMWVLAAVPNFVVVWKLIQRRVMGAPDHAFLLTIVPVYLVMSNFAVAGSFHPSGLLLRGWQYATGSLRLGVSGGFLLAGDLWMACVLSVALAIFSAWAAGRLERRTGWDVAAFLRGSLVGLGVACVLATIADKVAGWPAPTKAGQAVRLAMVALLMILGGWICGAWLRSALPACEGGSGIAPGTDPVDLPYSVRRRLEDSGGGGRDIELAHSPRDDRCSGRRTRMRN